jgi:hypothetical protein
MSNFAKHVLSNGGTIHPLLINSKHLNGFPSCTNPTIYNDNGKLYANIRNINYTLYHSEKKIYEHQWGPLVYIHPENDWKLRTSNIFCELDEQFNIKYYTRIDTSRFDTYEPMWDFVGLEDGRIVRWDNKLYIIGVRRDTTTNGEGRMELSEIEVQDQKVIEVSRTRIPCPGENKSYCEKNWVPIADKPYHFIKWHNGTEVVYYDTKSNTTTPVIQHNWKDIGCADLRGGSQIIPFAENYYLSLTHTTYLFKSPAGRKDGIYRHRFIVFNKNLEIVKVSEEFSFLGGDVEFSIGMTEYKQNILVTFGFQDNAAYLLKIPYNVLKQFIGL